jgi:hypothetical protein
MKLPFHAILLIVLILGAADTVSAQSLDVPQAAVSMTSSASTPLWAAWTDGIIGNRDRMIQATAIAIAIGIFILTRSTK